MDKNLIDEIEWIKSKINSLIIDKDRLKQREVPGNTWLLDNRFILTIPGEEEIRYPLGCKGYNFWVYSSGKMHSNDGLFSPFLKSAEGMEEKIGFYVGFPEKDGINFSTISLLPNVEFPGEIVSARYVLFSPHTVYYVTETPLMTFFLRVFLNKENHIFFTVYTENRTSEEVKPYIATFLNPYLRHSLSEGAEDRWFRKCRAISSDNYKSKNYSSFLVETNEDTSRTTSITNYGIVNRLVTHCTGSTVDDLFRTTSRKQFLGGSCSTNCSKSLKKGKFPGKKRDITAFTEIGIISEIIHCSILPGGIVRTDISFISTSDVKIKKLYEDRFLSPKLIDKELIDVRKIESKINSNIKVKTTLNHDVTINNEVFTPFFEHLKKQVEFCSLIKGYVQLSENSLIGIRDIFQALEAYLYWNPEGAREKILEAFNYIFINGRCPRQYSVPGHPGDNPKLDIRPFIDQGVWVISTLVTYLKVTNDYSILNEVCGYYILSSDESTWEKSDKKDSVLNHLFKIMDYLILNRCEKTSCSLALYGDWNDALDGLGVSEDPGKRYGDGVSVMTTLQLYQNLTEMVELLTLYPTEYTELIDRYKEVQNEIKNGLLNSAVIINDNEEQKIVHGWGEHRNYLVGSFKDTDNTSRDGLTSNAFWVLSGMLNRTQYLEKSILDAFHRLDSKYGFKTFNPGFPKDMTGVGRIKKLPIGTAENGAVYVHASTFAVMALFKMGESEKAWRALIKLLPFSHKKVSCSPFVIPNSYGENSELMIDGESMLDWQTGSSNVVFKTLIRYAMGVEAEYRGIWIQPAVWQPFNNFSITLNIKGINLTINYCRKDCKERTFAINGKQVDSKYDKTLKTKKIWIDTNYIKTKELIVTIVD